MSNDIKKQKQEKIIRSIIEGVRPELSRNPHGVYWVSIDLRSILIVTRARPNEAQDIANITLQILLEVIGSNATLLLSAFFFGFPSARVFDVKKAAIDTGSFAKLLLDEHYREGTLQPFYSFLVFGRHGEELLGKCIARSTGENSIFSWIIDHNAQHVTIGHHYAKSITSVHHAEHMADVSYRLEKSISGKIITPDREIEGEFSFFLRKLDTCDFSSLTFDCVKHFKAENIARSFLVGEGPSLVLAQSINTKVAHEAFMADLRASSPRYVDFYGPHRENVNVITPKDSDRLYLEEYRALKRS